jgi:hypothetical protein
VTKRKDRKWPVHSLLGKKQQATSGYSHFIYGMKSNIFRLVSSVERITKPVYFIICIYIKNIQVP